MNCELSDMRFLIMLLPGLGDAMTASPIISGAKGHTLHALTSLPPVTQYARALNAFERVEEVPFFSDPLRAAWHTATRVRTRYDAVIVPFPATRWQYWAVATAFAPSPVYIHDYSGLVRLIPGARLVPLRGGHRISENRRLGASMGLPVGTSAGYLVPDAWRATRIPGVIGVNVGTMRYKGNETRRWPLESFLDIIRRQRDKGRELRLFAGPHEQAESDLIRARVPEVRLVAKPLAEAARELAECSVFLGNDAGLSHLAAALDVPTLTIFGMTDPVRATPIGPALPLRGGNCAPCFDEGLKRFGCALNIDYRCLKHDLSIDDVDAAIDRALLQGLPRFKPADTGPFRLYGVSRSVPPN